jgi:hypothetical protein
MADRPRRPPHLRLVPVSDRPELATLVFRGVPPAPVGYGPLTASADVRLAGVWMAAMTEANLVLRDADFDKV